MANKEVYRVIVIDENEGRQNDIAEVIDKDKDYELMTKFKSAKAAVVQSSVFKPTLFLMSVESPAFREMIPSLRQNFPQAKILGTVSKWDNDIALECIKMGALGCIVKPFSIKDLNSSLEVFEKRGKPGPTTTVAYFSPKGSSGKTTLIANMAMLLAKESGSSVAIVDADLQFGDMSIFFDLDPERTILEAVRDVNYMSPLTLEPYFIPVAKNLRLLSCPRRPEMAELVDIASLTAVVRMSQSLFRYVLIDLPFGYSPFSVGMCELADVVFLTGMMNYGLELRHMKKSLSIFEGWSSMKQLEVVFSKVRPCTLEMKHRMAEQLSCPVHILPDEGSLMHQANSGRMARGLVGGSDYVRDVEDLTRAILLPGA